jgi:hypothetical protein
MERRALRRHPLENCRRFLCRNCRFIVLMCRESQSQTPKGPEFAGNSCQISVCYSALESSSSQLSRPFALPIESDSREFESPGSPQGRRRDYGANLRLSARICRFPRFLCVIRQYSHVLGVVTWPKRPGRSGHPTTSANRIGTHPGKPVSRRRATIAISWGASLQKSCAAGISLSMSRCAH